MSGARIDVTPDPTPAEEEAIRRALEALGLLEPGRPDGETDRVRPRIGGRDGSVTLSMRYLTP